ncbi:centriole, cilia and spindle-associated protein isoform X2 [Stigmatopora argus]
MVTKRLRSEYMKKFKDPKWETYGECYDELLRYRIKRRLLEQSHNPWFWSGSESDSDSAVENSPENNRIRLKGAERVEEPATAPPPEECEEVAKFQVPSLPVLEQDDFVCHPQRARDPFPPEEERRQEIVTKHKSVVHRGQQTAEPEKDPAAPQTQQIRLPRPKCLRPRPPRIKSAPARPPIEDDKHPFAMYASGERDADTAGRKTYNVRPLASTNQIHSSALRAKTRREAERLAQTQRGERRRVRSDEVDQNRQIRQPAFNPWLTEYMRSFTVRSR